MDMLKSDLSDPMSDSEFEDVSLQQLLASGEAREKDDHRDQDHSEHDDHDSDHNDNYQDNNDQDHSDDNNNPHDTHDTTTDMASAQTAPPAGTPGTTGTPLPSLPKKKYDPKDPLRPRRKKARRACYACQRAHLTCGDERPCQRCIKRGLADGCQDGVRKKAKYLHDAPPEALGGVLGPAFVSAPGAGAGAGVGAPKPPPSRSNNNRSNHRHPSTGSDVSASNVSFFGSSQPPPPPPPPHQPYPVFGQTTTTAGGGGGATQLPDGLPDGMAFGGPPQSPVSPGFEANGNAGSGNPSGSAATFSPALFDPSNPALFNFNLEGISFGSQYAAMEFGMLGHMSSGAADEDMVPANPGGGSASGQFDVFGLPVYDNNNNNNNNNPLGGTTAANSSSTTVPGSSTDYTPLGFYTQGNLQHGLPHAYAIAAAPPSLQSPSTDTNSPQPGSGGGGGGFEGSPGAYNRSLSNGGGNSANNNTNTGNNGRSSFQSTTPTPFKRSGTTTTATAAAAARLLPPSMLGKRQRDTTSIYEAVKEPYMYVHGFHRLIALLQGRYSATKILRIAKALASIRPSFIACTRTLNRQDLVFMEKCFQRTLFEYEDFMAHVSSPALVCRRTGEVAAVNKEFTALTGWTRAVLLGQAPNKNVNRPGGGGGGGGSAGSSTKLLNSSTAPPPPDTPQPLFLAELMDDDNVIEFYEDFAQLAFGDSRGSVRRKCRLLKYREGGEGAANEPSTTASGTGTGTTTPSGGASILSSRVARIDGEHGIAKLERDGKLECSYCWHIRRDTFDIPMMIVMNFLPCYYPNQEPHQLAV